MGPSDVATHNRIAEALKRCGLSNTGTLLDPDFRREERSVVRRALGPYQIDLPKNARLEREKLDRVIKSLWSERDEQVIGAIRLVGPGALFATPSELEWNPWLFPEEGSKEAIISRLNEIRQTVCPRVVKWWVAARDAPEKERRERAAKLLMSIGRALAGDQRGRRKATIPRLAVLQHYYEAEFRLQKAQEFLRRSEWGRRTTRQERLETTAVACGIPIREIQLFLNVDEEGQPRRDLEGQTLPVAAKREFAARSWTARQFHVGEPTVRRIINARRPQGRGSK
jgi:hypothetical protein